MGEIAGAVGRLTVASLEPVVLAEGVPTKANAAADRVVQDGV